MRLYKKAAVCLLTAAMAISMLTACGGGGNGGGGGGKTPSTLPTPDQIVLPDPGDDGSGGGSGGEGTETKPTKTPIIDVNNSKLAKFNEKYAGATEFYIEMLVESYSSSGDVLSSIQTRMAQKDSDLYLNLSIAIKNQKAKTSEFLTLKEGSRSNTYMLFRNSKVAANVGSANIDDDFTDTGIATELPARMWYTTVKVGPTDYYAEVYRDEDAEYTLCFGTNGDPVYMFEKSLYTGNLEASYLYKTIQAGVGSSRKLCALPRGFKNYRLDLEENVFYDANDNKYTLNPKMDSTGKFVGFTVLDKSGKDVTKNFKWVSEFFDLLVG